MPFAPKYYGALKPWHEFKEWDSPSLSGFFADFVLCLSAISQLSNNSPFVFSMLAQLWIRTQSIESTVMSEPMGLSINHVTLSLPFLDPLVIVFA